ncbi:hypothetical protein A1D31_29795 [Bradyrhizobium liaoningense]|nr:hypothetical protein A1D31_29795 [Bradyrhizobium liaoningense]
MQAGAIRFELMQGWHEVAKISFDRMVDPGDDPRLHASDWTTDKMSWPPQSTRRSTWHRDLEEHAANHPACSIGLAAGDPPSANRFACGAGAAAR